jgi:hypothetical protein
MRVRGGGDAEEKQTHRVASGQRAGSCDADSGTEDRRRELTTGHPNGAKVAQPCLTTWPDSLPGDSQIQIIQVTGPAAKDFIEVIYLLDAKVQEFTKCNPRAYQMESGRRQTLLCLSMKRHCSDREQPKNNRRLLTDTRTCRLGELRMLHTRISRPRA